MLIGILCVIGFLLWLLSFAPLDETIKRLIHGIFIFLAIVAVVLFVLELFGIKTGVNLF